jgi:hypothetical protein
MRRRLTLCVLTSIVLLLCTAAVRAYANDVKLSNVTPQDLLVSGVVDKPNVSLVLVDTKTNQVIGQAVTKADSKGAFSTRIAFSSPLKDDNELVLSVTDSDDHGIKTITDYIITLNCWFKAPSTDGDPCRLIVTGPIVGGNTMIHP